MKRNELISLVESGRDVTLKLVEAEIVSVKKDFIHMRPGVGPVGHRFTVRTLSVTKIIVKDSELGAIYFSGFSEKLKQLYRGQKISLKVTVTGVGTPSNRYPDPILFAKPHTRRGDSVVIKDDLTEDRDNLPVNI